MANDESNAPAAAATTAPEKAKRTQLAEHEFIDANGAVQEQIEHATGIRYTDKLTGAVFSYQIPDAVAGSVGTMLALFGAKTKATNAASAARQARERSSDFTHTDVEYIASIFDAIKDGQWEVPGEGKREPKYDLDVLTDVIVELLAASGKTQDREKMRAKLESDIKFRRGALARPEIKQAYNDKVGKAAAPIDSLLVE